MSIDRFHDALGSPRVLGSVESDWQDLEAMINLELPLDYKQFVSAYGPECVNENLYLFHPKVHPGSDALPLLDLLGQVARTYPVLAQDDPDLCPYPIFPEEGGAVAVGRTTSGNCLFLLPPNRPGAAWSILMEMGGWFSFEMKFTDFLWSALVGELEVPVIDGEAGFEPMGSVADA